MLFKLDRKQLPSKITFLYFAATGILFIFCFLTERALAEEGNIIWTASYTIRTLALSFILGTLGGIAACITMYRFSIAKPFHSPSNACPLRPLQLFLCSLILIVLAWLPGYLAYYPGICAYDSPIQTGQIESGSFNDHHPIAHTLLLKGFMELGENLAGNVNTGIGIYTFLQLIFLAAVFAWGITVLKKLGTGMFGLILLQLICMFYPFNWYMSISTTKDIPFTGFFLLLLLALAELILQIPSGPANRKPLSPKPDTTHPRDEALPEIALPTKRKAAPAIRFAVGAVGVILFRNNGQYSFLVLLSFLFLTTIFCKNHKSWGKLLLLAVGSFLSGVLLLNLLFHTTGAQQGDKREMLSMPIQQFARAMVYHGGIGVLPEDDNTLEEAEKALINDFLLDEAYRDYDPHISDPVKRHTNTYVARYRAKEFILTYLNLLKRYPGDFLNAALEVNAGYLYPADVSHAYINESEVNSGLGYVQTRWEESTLNSRGIYKDSKWKWLHEKMERWADENAYLKLPVLRYLFMPGIWLWLYFLLFGFLAVQKKGLLGLPLALVLGYYLTLFLGPTVQLRYLYPVMAAWPFLALLYGRISRLRA